mgnify:CR=1 FL=1
MRCVSYTRTTSCKEDGKIPADIIKQQDQHIQEYLKKECRKLSQILNFYSVYYYNINRRLRTRDRRGEMLKKL